MISTESNNFAIGPIPTFDDLKEFMNNNPSRQKESWTSIKEKSAEIMLMKELYKTWESNQKHVQSVQKKRLDNSVFVTREGSSVGGGTETVLNALAAYLRYLEGTARDDWQEYVVNIISFVPLKVSLQ